MSEKRKLRISSVVASFVRAGLGGAEKLRGIEAASAMTPVDHVTLLFCLMRDTDPHVKEAGTTAFGVLPEALLLSCIAAPDIHPAIFDAVARFHHDKPAVVSSLLECPALSPEAHAFLGRVAVKDIFVDAVETAEEGTSDDGAVDAPADGTVAPPEQGPAEIGQGDDATDDVVENDEFGPEEEDEEHLSKYKLIQQMGIGEKIKMALTGDKEWRSILVNDTNKLVSSSVIKNPRITDGEILRILKVGVQNDEIVRLICENREWIKSPLIRKALVDCPKTPLPNALRYLASLGDREIAAYAKSKNVSSVISTQAKRIILAKKR